MTHFYIPKTLSSTASDWKEDKYFMSIFYPITSSTYTWAFSWRTLSNGGIWAPRSTKGVDWPRPTSPPRWLWSMWRSPKSIPTLGYNLCFFSRVEDQVIWIHGPIRKEINVTTLQHFLHFTMTMDQAPHKTGGPIGQSRGSTDLPKDPPSFHFDSMTSGTPSRR